MSTATAPTEAAPAAGTHLIRRALPAVSVLLLAGAFWVLHRELTLHHPRDIWRAILGLPPGAILFAAGLTTIGYLLLSLYDVLALRYVRQPVGMPRTMFTGFVAYAFSQTLGFPLLTGSSIRYRLYSAWGLSAVEIAQLIAFTMVTFWLGVLSVSGAVLAAAPADAATVFPLPGWAIRVLGIVMLGIVLGYLTATNVRHRPVHIRGWRIHLPPPRLAAAQLGLACLDWTVAAAVLYVLLPAGGHVSFWALVAVFVLAQVAGVVSHVPGGLGVFESLVVLAFRGQFAAPELVGSLVMYRVVYYLGPFLLATALFVAYEARQRREAVSRMAQTLGRWIPAVTPRALAAVTFLAGAVLLFSGALPAEPGRLRWLDDLIPLPLIELSHFLGSLTGLGLLVLSWGIARRLDGAYHMAIGLLGAGIVASLLKGADYEEALILSLVLLLLLPAREWFYRKASLLHEPFSPGWLVAIGTVLVSALWLGLFAYRHVPYAGELWWQFTLHGDAPRFLRATVGMLATASAFGLARLIRPAGVRAAPPTPDDLTRAAAIAQRAPRTYAWLALLGDKSLLFDPNGAAFIMYGVSGRTWVAMGDPVGDAAAFPDLVWEFRELTDRHDGLTVFYQATPEYLPLYLELGLRPLKVGEEASVLLPSFSLEGGGHRGLRRTRREVEGQGCRFELLPGAHPPAVLEELGKISGAWLAEKKTREKGFSLGRFAPEYLSRFPLAVVRKNGQIVAFSNVWIAGNKQEISPDLMRYLPDAPPGVMEYLFIELMLWGKAEGYQRFNLGMAPLSGIEGRSLAPLWSRINALVFRHGEHFYNFQGLRHYKEKFDPEWSPRYLAAPGGWLLPRVLADIAALISGGLRGVVAR